jgi:hypothetical protein
VMPSGSPYPTITWQRRVGGFWQSIDADDSNYEVDGGVLTVLGTNLEQTGSLFRAQLRNRVGTTYTRVARLTVSEPSLAPRQVAAGDLGWGVRASFRTYVAGPIAHGTITASGGAQVATDGTYTFRFVSGRVDPATEHVAVRYAGTVRFTGHDGPPTCAVESSPCLDLSVADPRLEITGDTGVLHADVTSKDMETGAVNRYPDVALARLDTSAMRLQPDSVELPSLPATLTETGSPAFAGFYAAGDALDPVTTRLTLGAEITPPPTTPGTQSPDTRAASTTRVTLPARAARYGRTTVATVAVEAGGAPATGSVSVSVDGRTQQAVLADGSARVHLPADLRPGSHTVRVEYAGTAAAAPSAAAATLRSTRGTVRLTGRARPVPAGRAVRLVVRATVPGRAIVPAGRLVVRDGGRTVARATLRTGDRGRTTVRVRGLRPGVHHLRVRFARTGELRAQATPVVVRVR